jgi:hypothetical protein
VTNRKSKRNRRLARGGVGDENFPHFRSPGIDFRLIFNPIVPSSSFLESM